MRRKSISESGGRKSQMQGRRGGCLFFSCCLAGASIFQNGVSMAILAPSCGGTASQWPFWFRHVAGQRLNGHFGLIMWRDGVSMAILVPSCGGTASQWSFWSRRVAGRRLNGHFGSVMRRDGVLMAILVSSCGGTASQWSFWFRHVAGRCLKNRIFLRRIHLGGDEGG